MATGSNWKIYKKKNMLDIYNLTINVNYLVFFFNFRKAEKKKEKVNSLKRKMRKSFLDKASLMRILKDEKN